MNEKNQDLTAVTEDVEGLVKDDVDDVSGHVQPRRDLDVER